MATFLIYYRRDPMFREDIGLTEDQVLGEETHVYLKRLAGVELENVFWQMQGEVWSPFGEVRDLIKSRGLHRTSMSIGDCVYDLETDIVYEWCSKHWRKVPKVVKSRVHNGVIILTQKEWDGIPFRLKGVIDDPRYTAFYGRNTLESEAICDVPGRSFIEGNNFIIEGKAYNA